MAVGLHEYVESLNSLLNRSITRSRLTALTVRGSRRAVITRRVGGAFSVLELSSGWLRFEQEIVHERDQAITVVRALYIYYRGQGFDERAWVFRYEYEDSPGEAKPHSHLHVNGVHSIAADDLSRIHFPVGPMGAEHVIWLLINEFECRSVSDVSQELRASYESHELQFGQGLRALPFP